MSGTVLPFIPRPGRSWHGGVYVTRVGERDLIVGPLLEEPTDWATASQWAATLRAYGAADFTLPTLGELRELARTFPRFFSSEVYWSCETHPDLPGDAMVAHFDAGLEAHWSKHHRCNAIAVRRA